jgi:hypothetical protein
MIILSCDLCVFSIKVLLSRSNARARYLVITQMRITYVINDLHYHIIVVLSKNFLILMY